MCLERFFVGGLTFGSRGDESKVCQCQKYPPINCPSTLIMVGGGGGYIVIVYPVHIPQDLMEEEAGKCFDDQSSTPQIRRLLEQIQPTFSFVLWQVEERWTF